MLILCSGTHNQVIHNVKEYPKLMPDRAYIHPVYERCQLRGSRFSNSYERPPKVHVFGINEGSECELKR